MNRLFRNLFFWGVIFLVLFSVVTLLTDNGTETKEFSVQEFKEALNKGEIKETGRHEELIAKGGLYAQLNKLQYKNLLEA